MAMHPIMKQSLDPFAPKDRPELSEAHASYLRMYSAGTYSIKLGSIGKEMEALGLVEWVPSWMPGSHDYAITDLGRRAIALGDEAQSKAAGK